VAWIALCSLVAGLLLLGLGAWNLLTGINRWSRIPAGLLAVIAVPLTVYTLAIPMAATTSPRAESAPQTPVGWTDVTFSTSDGVRLSGWFTPSRNGAGIVVVPGSGSNRTGALTQAQVLADAGFAVLVYDPRGHGDSGGRAMEFGWAGDADVSAAVDFLAARPTVRSGQLGALGLSMGGEQVLGAAAADPRIEAVVAEGATNRVADDFAWLSSRYGWRGMIQRVLDAPRFALVDALADQSPPISLRTAVERISPRPVLLIAAGEVPDEGYATFHIAGDSASVQTWLVPGAGHTGALSRAPDQWRRTVVGFFDRNLL
jgi:pimeloyl-ACP methyl ester carboxylesterase